MTDENESSQQKFCLRVVPWWTDGCSNFLNNMFKWLPNLLGRQLTALEVGGGNSTFYLLGKGLKVLTIESDDGYIDLITKVSGIAGYKTKIIQPGFFSTELFLDYDSVVVKANSIQEVDRIISQLSWDLIVNDGISRREVLEEILKNNTQTILVLDNVEFCANWGKLSTSSAKPALVKVYRHILRDKNWRHYIFEQPEGREGRASADKSGWEAPHRWASAILWPDNHLLAMLMVSNIGMPLVNELGINDADTETLEERCPYDWNEMKWIKPGCPEELDLRLDRGFD